ncbi:putative DNA binding domain-containing protein [Frankia sp. Ag45/Mut15]|uniref:DNA binding domain-containing protein n=1 Tax=Frankia umida TaxID=573489 RepID=A0ABT0JW54_9ACTN|nr:ATP-binding protein [Frankia umida]MCK9875457.1 putative DNA binding domain-containing protein [Frankia umida]
MDRETVARTIGDLARLGNDNYRFEIKKARGGMPQSLHETISAFANGEGGTVLLGVDEKAAFAVSGLADPRSISDSFVTLCRSMDPVVAPLVDIVDMGGPKVLYAYVPPIPRDRRPCHLARLAPWDASFVRMSDGDRKLSAYEVQLLLENRAPARHDASVVPEATQDDLDSQRLRAFVARVREQRSVFETRSDAEVLRLLNVLRETDDGPRPTLAGLLAFGIYPQQYFPQLNATVVVFPTPDPARPGPRGERFLDNRSVDGPIPVIVRDVIGILKRHMKRRGIITGLFRVDEWEYPEEVLRETLVNSLVHRDYSPSAQGAQIQVELYPDRLQIRNPGGLFGPVGLRELGLGTVPPSSRNSVLLKILEDTPLDPGRTVCENRGTGIARVRAALAEAGMEPPVFEDDIATFTVTIPNHALLDEDTRDWLSTLNIAGLTGAQLTALALTRRGETLTNVSYRGATGVADSRTATTQLKELRARGLLVREGDRGSATYRLSPHAGRATKQLDRGRTQNDLVLAVLTRTPVSRAEIARQAGLTDEQARQTLARLRRIGQAELVGAPRSRNALWRLADPSHHGG